MDPSYNNSFGQFGSGVGSGVGQPGIAIVSSPASAKRSNRKIIAVIVGVVVAVVAVAVVILALGFGRGSSSSDIYSTLWNFYYSASYQDLVEGYDLKVGKTPHLQSEDNDVVFPVSDGWISSINEEIESSRVAYEELAKLSPNSLSGDGRKEFDSIIKNTKNTMDIIESNVGIISDFYDAFIVPLNDLYREGKAISCVKTEAISALINNPIFGSAANTYFSAYCKTIETYYDADKRDILQGEILGLVDEALGSLDAALSDVEDTSENEIEKLLSELSQ